MAQAPTRVAALSDVALELTTVPIAQCSDDELLEMLRVAEAAHRQLAFFDQVLLAELAQRGVATRVGYRSLGALLRDVLRVSPSAAAARLRAAAVAGPRQALDGQSLEPLLAVAAHAQAEGVLSPGHLRVISDVIDKIPAAARADWAEPVEVSLVTHATDYDPAALAKVGSHLIDLLDPDGTLSDDADRARRRDLTLLINADGTGTLRGTTDAHLTELLAVVFDSLGLRPTRPATASGDSTHRPGLHGVEGVGGEAEAADATAAATDDGTAPAAASDTRTPGQRRHDALVEVLRPIVSSGQLPATGGIPATILLTATADQWETGQGLVTTGHGAVVSVPTAHRIAGGDARIVPVILGQAKQITAYGTAHRIFTKAQRYAIIARDGGCTWPGCDRPPSMCEVNHVIPWAKGGKTSVANGALLCAGGDHPNLDHNGWTATMINGIPHYIPPPWIDPQQRPRRNYLHHPVDT
jgi:Domain of unknown function (DUF222)/HNH endonuclease